MAGMFDQAKALLKAKKVQSELAKTEIEANGGDGLVTVIFTADLKLKSIVIDPSLLAPDEKLTLERLLKESITQALQQAQQIAAEKTKTVMQELGVRIPGL
ncbi:YbaB/EbfC family nucleoid-associated protein [Candidatus Berkelbacteria bacterium]|nr:YbaB/EbfC family nucleoid-associated protein [Candidatus Berkelbacteria bacterium]